MDSSDLPQKLYRHVLKAIEFFRLINEKAEYKNILRYIKLSNRNLRPIDNVDSAVKKALSILCDCGLAINDGDNGYCLTIRIPRHESNETQAIRLSDKKSVTKKNKRSENKPRDSATRSNIRSTSQCFTSPDRKRQKYSFQTISIESESSSNCDEDDFKTKRALKLPNSRQSKVDNNGESKAKKRSSDKTSRRRPNQLSKQRAPTPYNANETNMRTSDNVEFNGISKTQLSISEHSLSHHTSHSNKSLLSNKSIKVEPSATKESNKSDREDPILAQCEPIGNSASKFVSDPIELPDDRTDRINNIADLIVEHRRTLRRPYFN